MPDLDDSPQDDQALSSDSDMDISDVASEAESASGDDADSDYVNEADRKFPIKRRRNEA